MSRIMIMTLGGSPEPLRKSIAEYRPDLVVFLASHESTAMAGAVLDGLEKPPQYRFEITEESDVLLDCYEAARWCGDPVYSVQTHDFGEIRSRI